MGGKTTQSNLPSNCNVLIDEISLSTEKKEKYELVDLSTDLSQLNYSISNKLFSPFLFFFHQQRCSTYFSKPHCWILQ